MKVNKIALMLKISRTNKQTHASDRMEFIVSIDVPWKFSLVSIFMKELNEKYGINRKKRTK